jgi:hypothetical protein
MSAFSVIVLFERAKSTAQHPLPDRDQRVIYPQPVVIEPVPVGVVVQPIYRHVPPGHAKNWSRGEARTLWSTEREPSPRGGSCRDCRVFRKLLPRETYTLVFTRWPS